MYLGSWKIDDALTLTCNTHTASTGAATDADSVPTYRVYEDETGTAILTGSMALLDDANTVGHYSEQITLSAANGLEKGKTYSVRIEATVDSIAGATVRSFQIEAEVDANVVSGTVATVTAVTNGVSLANDAITSAKYDESTAFPLKADDAGATQVARVGADGDTLETLSDEIAVVDANVDAILLDTGTDGVVLATDAVDAGALAADAVDEIWDEVIEGAYTGRQMFRLFAAALAGKASGGGTTTLTFTGVDGSTSRIIATVDANGNRTALTLDAS